MKRYEKPEIEFEELQVAERIAGTCWGTHGVAGESVQFKVDGGETRTAIEQGYTWGDCENYDPWIPYDVWNVLGSLVGGSQTDASSVFNSSSKGGNYNGHRVDFRPFSA